MINRTDDGVEILYILIKDADEPMINEQQRTAVAILGDLARTGNVNAIRVLNELLRAPFLHPLLHEMIAAELQIPLRTPCLSTESNSRCSTAPAARQ